MYFIHVQEYCYMHFLKHTPQFKSLGLVCGIIIIIFFLLCFGPTRLHLFDQKYSNLQKYILQNITI